MELRGLKRFQFVVANNALALSRYVEQVSSRAIEHLQGEFAPIPFSRKEQWDMGVQQFFLYAEMDGRDKKMIGFTLSRMSRHGICDRETWDAYTRVLGRGGVLVVISRKPTRPAIREGGLLWNRHALRHALKSGTLVLPYPTDEDPPYLPELRYTAAQIPQHSTSRTKAPRATQALVIPEKQPVQGQITVSTAPVWVEVGMPEWLRFESDRIERVLASHRFPVRVENAVVRDGIKAFALHLHTRNGSERIAEMGVELALALGVEHVSIQVYPAQHSAVISAVAQ